MPLKFDIDNTNFDYFFLEQATQMSEHQKERLPKELLYKVFVKGFRVNTKSTSKLGFIAKLFVLVRALNKRWILMVEDDEKGMNEEDFFKWKELTKRRNYTSDSATDLISEGQFCLGNSELFDGFHKLNSLSTSPAYTYIQKTKNKLNIPIDEYKRNMKFLISWINNFEAMRKKIVMESGISMAEWLTLTYLYDGKEKVGAILYTEKFRYSYNTSRTKIKLSFGTLQNKGFITKYGYGKGCKLQITALGTDKINSISEKYLVNC
jgi:hypothetical protein